MKIFLIVDGFCHKDYSREYKTAKEAAKFFDKNTKFVETPDYVFEGWGYDETAKGDDRFIKPMAPEGFAYDDATGTFYRLLTGKEKREQAYAMESRVTYEGEEMTVNEAEQKAMFYLFEDTETAAAIVAELKRLITTAKAEIRKDYSDENEPYK